MSGLDTDLEGTLKALETSFCVRLIETREPDVVWAPPDAKAVVWLSGNHPGFDQFPVRQDSHTVGILIRGENYRDETVREAMQPLRDGLIVSADMPIADLIPQLRENHYRLVLRGGRIDGLVTQSDLLKLPVRMLLFGLLSHLELCLREVVRNRAPWPAWLELLAPKRRRAISRELKKLEHFRLEPDALECTNLSDVLDVLSYQPDQIGGSKAESEAIRKLRNDIAHVKPFITSADQMRQFVDDFIYTRERIDCITRMLNVS